jgi:hypothetical protein
LREWIAAIGSQNAYIAPGRPWENGYCESFNSKLRDELLVGEIFFSRVEAQVLIEAWRRQYNGVRPTAPSTTDRRRLNLSSPAAAASCRGRPRQLDRKERDRPTPTVASETGRH